MHFAIIFLDRKGDWKGGLKAAFLHFPLVIPIMNTYYAYKIFEIEYEDPMSSFSLTKIENLKMVAGKLSQTEAFMVRK